VFVEDEFNERLCIWINSNVLEEKEKKKDCPMQCMGGRRKRVEEKKLFTLRR